MPVWPPNFTSLASTPNNAAENSNSVDSSQTEADIKSFGIQEIANAVSSTTNADPDKSADLPNASAESSDDSTDANSDDESLEKPCTIFNYLTKCKYIW